MKSYVLLASIALLSFTACKKKYTCTCKISGGMPGVFSADSSFVVPLEKLKKKDAKARCSANDKSFFISDPSFGTISVTQACTIS